MRTSLSPLAHQPLPHGLSRPMPLILFGVDLGYDPDLGLDTSHDTDLDLALGREPHLGVDCATSHPNSAPHTAAPSPTTRSHTSHREFTQTWCESTGALGTGT